MSLSRFLEIVRVLNTTEAKEKCFNIGTEVVGGTPEQLAADYIIPVPGIVFIPGAKQRSPIYPIRR